MAVIKPFKAWHYNSEKIKSWKDVVVPPYDVISPEGLKTLKKKSAHSFSHIILAEGSDRHKQAAETFRKWQAEGMMIEDTAESFYLYRQTFFLDQDSRFLQSKLQDYPKDKAIQRVGFFARVGLEKYEDKVILPHEKTFSGPKKDRYELMENMQGNAEPVFLGYPSDRFSGDEFVKITLDRKADVKYTDDDQVTHELWHVDDKAVIEEMEKVIKGQQLFILDGHHRYETALKFYEDHKSSDAKLSHRYVLAQVCSLHQFGAIILPTHRLVKGMRAGFEEPFLQMIKRNWKVTPVDTLKSLEAKLLGAKGCAFGLVLKEDLYFMEYEKERGQRLDLDILQDELIAKVLSAISCTRSDADDDKVVGGSMHDDSHGGCELGFSKSPTDSVNKVKEGDYQAAFIVRPSSVDDVVNTARAGKVMPHKSTFFFPKIPSGLVVNLFD